MSIKNEITNYTLKLENILMEMENNYALFKFYSGGSLSNMAKILEKNINDTKAEIAMNKSLLESNLDDKSLLNLTINVH